MTKDTTRKESAKAPRYATRLAVQYAAEGRKEGSQAVVTEISLSGVTLEIPRVQKVKATGSVGILPNPGAVAAGAPIVVQFVEKAKCDTIIRPISGRVESNMKAEYGRYELRVAFAELGEEDRAAIVETIARLLVEGNARSLAAGAAVAQRIEAIK